MSNYSKFSPKGSSSIRHPTGPQIAHVFGAPNSDPFEELVAEFEAVNNKRRKIDAAVAEAKKLEYRLRVEDALLLPHEDYVKVSAINTDPHIELARMSWEQEFEVPPADQNLERLIGVEEQFLAGARRRQVLISQRREKPKLKGHTPHNLYGNGEVRFPRRDDAKAVYMMIEDVFALTILADKHRFSRSNHKLKMHLEEVHASKPYVLKGLRLVESVADLVRDATLRYLTSPLPQKPNLDHRTAFDNFSILVSEIVHYIPGVAHALNIPAEGYPFWASTRNGYTPNSDAKIKPRFKQPYVNDSYPRNNGSMLVPAPPMAFKEPVPAEVYIQPPPIKALIRTIDSIGLEVRAIVNNAYRRY